MSEKDKISIGKKTYFLSIISVAVVVFVLSYGVFSLTGKNQDRQDNQMSTPSNAALSPSEFPPAGVQGQGSAPEPPVQTNAADISIADSYIGEEAAWTTALNHAGLKETEVSKKKVQLDMEDGTMVYEVEFEKGWTEYDYEINAVSGEIIKAEKDID